MTVYILILSWQFAGDSNVCFHWYSTNGEYNVHKLPFNTQELSIFVPQGHRLVFCFESTLTIYNTFVIDIIDPVWR
jgi:hypothetical protein